jgi:hypothetical protein
MGTAVVPAVDAAEQDGTASLGPCQGKTGRDSGSTENCSRPAPGHATSGKVGCTMRGNSESWVEAVSLRCTCLERRRGTRASLGNDH